MEGGKGKCEATAAVVVGGKKAGARCMRARMRPARRGKPTPGRQSMPIV